VGPEGYAADYLPEDEPLLAARGNAADLGGTEPVLPAVGAALRFLACAVGAKAAVEIGTGCGSSGIWLLRGMRPGSTLTSVDIEPEYQRMARKAFAQAGFAQNQCRLILGRALDVLPRLSDGAYDMVFCDADPRDYPDYLTAALRLLRPGGVVAFNNALPPGAWGEGQDDEADDPALDPAIDPALGLASKVRADDRLVPVLLPLGDGLLAAVKRGD
jgi:predicted O-methyltransferase YrrM